MIILGEHGHLAALEATPSKPTALSFTESPLMKGSCYGSPAITNNCIILKDEQRVAAFKIE